MRRSEVGAYNDLNLKDCITVALNLTAVELGREVEASYMTLRGGAYNMCYVKR